MTPTTPPLVLLRDANVNVDTTPDDEVEQEPEQDAPGETEENAETTTQRETLAEQAASIAASVNRMWKDDKVAHVNGVKIWELVLNYQLGKLSIQASMPPQMMQGEATE